MLLDAFAAERIRLIKAKGAVFWGFLFVPVASLVIGLATHIFFNIMMRNAGGNVSSLTREPMDLGRQAADAMTGGNFFLVQLFFMIGATAILATDYRWETWRLLTPRNTRTNLMLAKLGTFGVAAAVGLLLMGLAGILSGVFGALLNGHPIILTSGPVGTMMAQLWGSLLTSWLELMVLAAFAACIAVLSRSGLGAMLAAVGVSIVQAFLISQLRMPDPTHPPLKYLAALPAFAAELLRSSLMSGPLDVKPSGTGFALLFLVLWIAGLTALAVFLFKRQDLTRE